MATDALQQLAEDLVLVLAGRSAATAESCSGGRLGAALTAIRGASAWYRGGVIAYQPEVKRNLLGVRAPSVLSERAVSEMAVGVARLLGAEVAMATSGVAGASPQDGVPPGTVFVGTVVDGDVRTETHRLHGDRATVAVGAARLALQQALDHLRDHPPSRRPTHGAQCSGGLD